MAEKTFNTRIKHKRDTHANWTTNNPVLLDGEIAVVVMGDGEIRQKVGNGTSSYTALDFLYNDMVVATDVVETDIIPNDAVKYSVQSLTNAQKAQARTNIGAADSSQVALKTHLCNPNLLDNWYFGNPINQRGQTSYTGNVYTIDRWRHTNDTCSSLVSNGKVTLTAGTSTLFFRQIIEFPEQYYGKTITVSALTASGEFTSKTGTIPTTIPTSSATGVAVANFSSGDYFACLLNTDGNIFAQFKVNANTSLDILAAKLELGDTQTLAHQNSAGTWVLNEIPDYGEQLARCQRYFINLNPNHDGWFTIGSGYMIDNTTAELVVPIPVTMRAYPSIVTNGFNFGSPSGSGGLTSASIYNMGSSSLNLHCVTTKGVAKEPCFAYASAEQYVWLSADL